MKKVKEQEEQEEKEFVEPDAEIVDTEGDDTGTDETPETPPEPWVCGKCKAVIEYLPDRNNDEVINDHITECYGVEEIPKEDEEGDEDEDDAEPEEEDESPEDDEPDSEPEEEEEDEDDTPSQMRLYYDFEQEFLKAHPEKGRKDAIAFWKETHLDWEFNEDEDEVDIEDQEVPEELTAEADKIKPMLEILGKRGTMLNALDFQGHFPNPTSFNATDEATFAKYLKELCDLYGITITDLWYSMNISSHLAGMEIFERQQEEEEDEEEEADHASDHTSGKMDFDEFSTDG